MKIGELAGRTGLAPSAIRFYEASGLLPPATRGANGYRTYSDAALQKLRVIQVAQRLGFSLESLRAVLAWENGTPHELIVERLQSRLAEIDALQATLRSQRRETQALIVRLQEQWAQGQCLELGAADVAPAAAQPRRRVGR
jgi:DNA-binding transcriptional MerR regulator